MSHKPVTVAVISDTHVDHLAELPSRLLEVLTKADMIVHLGDYTTPELLHELRQFGNFHGIIGNHDSLISRRELKVMEVIELEGKRLGLIHGLFLPIGRPKRMTAWFRKQKIDVLLCGHSHLINNRRINGVLLFNPGTVTGQFPATLSSFGLLTIDGTIKSEIIPLEHNILEKTSFGIRILAFIIRNGIRWLEAWPYVDLTYLLSRTRAEVRRLWDHRSGTVNK